MQEYSTQRQVFNDRAQRRNLNVNDILPPEMQVIGGRQGGGTVGGSSSVPLVKKPDGTPMTKAEIDAEFDKAYPPGKLEQMWDILTGD